MSDTQVIREDHGFVQYRHAPGGTVEIVEIEVAGDHRMQGVGRRLVAEVVRRTRGEGARTIYAITRADNRPAQEFYYALGFRVCAPLYEFYDPRCATVDAILFSRPTGGPL